MKVFYSLIIALVANAAFAHDSTVPHVHPHGFSILPDWAVLALTAVLIGGAALFIQSRRRVK
jgi:hypothetical protein